MATHSTIALERNDGIVEQVYCHWDGYLENNGKILKDHWSDPVKLQTLLNMGDLSSLGSEIGTAHQFDELVSGNACTFYTRDRGDAEGLTRKIIYPDFTNYLEDGRREEYNYVLRKTESGYEWFVQIEDFYGSIDEAREQEL